MLLVNTEVSSEDLCIKMSFVNISCPKIPQFLRHKEKFLVTFVKTFESLFSKMSTVLQTYHLNYLGS